MKIIQEGRVLGRWNLSVVIGFVVTAIGMGVGLLLVNQLLPALSGNPLTIGGEVLILEAVTSLLMTLLGFSLMVIGSDPFDDVTGDFQSPVEDEETQRVA